MIESSRRTQVHSPSLRFLLPKPLRATVPARSDPSNNGEQRQTRVEIRGKQGRWSFYSCGRVWESAEAGSVAPIGSGIV